MCLSGVSGMSIAEKTFIGGYRICIHSISMGQFSKETFCAGSTKQMGTSPLSFGRKEKRTCTPFPLTSNVDEVLPEGCALLDVNNLPMHELESLLEDNHIAEPTGDFRASGFVIYPEYRFFPEALEKMEFVE